MTISAPAPGATECDPGDNQDHVLAIDIGGTKFAVGVVDADGQVLYSERVPTYGGSQGNADALWERLHGLCERVLEAAGRPHIVGIGVGCGGPMSWPAGIVSPVNILPWREFPLRDRLRAAYPGVPVRVHNDAVAVVVAEHWRGAGSAYEDMLGMVVSTGVGGGLILGGHLVDGGTGNAGHVGHMVVDPVGPVGPYGVRGTLEGIASGPWLVSWARDQGWRVDDPEAAGRELAADAFDGDKLAVAAFERAGHALGVGIASAVALCDVRRVVVGGGLAQAGELLFEPLRDTLHEYLRIPFAQEVTVGPASLGQEAGLVGAAALVLAGDRYWSADES